MRDQGLTRREEARLIKAYQRVLLGGGFPNPDRAGCPGNETLRAMAFRKLEAESVKHWIEHLGTCSPCFGEYAEFRRQVEWRRKAACVAMAAAVVIVVFSFGWWRWRSSQPPVITAHHHVVADLRNRMIFRGDQGTRPGNGPLVFERGFDEVTIYLPEGSRGGNYEAAIFREELGEPLANATGLAKMEKGMTSLNAMLDLSRVAPGRYLLGIRPSGADWSYSPLVIE
jgi:hypothetical protein